jgi:hypothetical protein
LGQAIWDFIAKGTDRMKEEEEEGEGEEEGEAQDLQG